MSNFLVAIVQFAHRFNLALAVQLHASHQTHVKQRSARCAHARMLAQAVNHAQLGNTWHTHANAHTHTHPHMMHCIRHFSSHEATTHSTHNNIFVICNMRACGHPTQHYTTKQITLRTMKIDGAHRQVIDIGVVKACQPQYGVIWWQIRLIYFIYIIYIYIYIYTLIARGQPQPIPCT